MGSNKNSQSTDPRGRSQDYIGAATDRYQSQQGPMVNSMAENYGRGSEANYGDYTDIMNQYRGIASGASGAGSGGGGGGYASGAYGGPGYQSFHVTPGQASYKDPFKSYSGYEEFSKTGGYSGEDIANMRSRGVSPIRAAYANAEREVGRQRSLQGGYSANAGALAARMAREQGQSAADASQNVEAGLAVARNQGRLAGLGGMAGIEGQRLGADVDLSKFNTGMDYQGQVYNADADTQADQGNIGIGRANAQMGASAANAGRDASMADRMNALRGMTALYGTTPGMSETFGNQLLQGVGQGGQFSIGMANAMNNGQQLPGQFDQTMNRVGQVTNAASGVSAPLIDYFGNRQRRQQQTPGYGGIPDYNSGVPVDNTYGDFG